ncbi:MAG: hypothetical protein ACFE9S_07695 [Candidatus Hermodarchaeota archaeon]
MSLANGVSPYFNAALNARSLATMMTNRTKNWLNLFVDGQVGSDSNSGENMEEAFVTIAAAITKANAAIDWSVWGPRINIWIAPDVYAENLTALPYGCNLIGLGDAFDVNGERGVTIKPATGSPVDCTSIINTRVENICFQSLDSSAVFQADTFNRNVIKNCVFLGLPGASPTTTRGIEVVKDCTGNRISDCMFLQIRNGIYIVTDNANQKQISGTIFERLYIGGGDQTGMYFHANCTPAMVWINECQIGDGSTTLALGLDDNTGAVTVSNTNFVATACDPASADSDSKYNNCYLNGSLMS